MTLAQLNLYLEAIGRSERRDITWRIQASYASNYTKEGVTELLEALRD